MVINNDIQVSPEVQELKEKCELLRGELVSLLTEWDHLVDTVSPNLQAQYVTTIGVKEYESLQLDVEVRRLKRTIEMIQAMENQDKKPNLEQIEAAVETELAEWQAKVEQMMSDIEASQERLKNLLSGEQSKELLQLYRALAKKLHPDVNPNLTEEQKALWVKVQQAYELGDLEALRALALVVEEEKDAGPLLNSLELLKQHYDKLVVKVRDKANEIQQLKATPPLSLEDKLSDPEWVNDQLAACGEKIEALWEQKEQLTQWLKQWKARA